MSPWRRTVSSPERMRDVVEHPASTPPPTHPPPLPPYGTVSRPAQFRWCMTKIREREHIYARLSGDV